MAVSPKTAAESGRPFLTPVVDVCKEALQTDIGLKVTAPVKGVWGAAQTTRAAWSGLPLPAKAGTIVVLSLFYYWKLEPSSPVFTSRNLARDQEASKDSE